MAKTTDWQKIKEYIINKEKLPPKSWGAKDDKLFGVWYSLYVLQTKYPKRTMFIPDTSRNVIYNPVATFFSYIDMPDIGVEADTPLNYTRVFSEILNIASLELSLQFDKLVPSYKLQLNYDAIVARTIKYAGYREEEPVEYVYFPENLHYVPLKYFTWFKDVFGDTNFNVHLYDFASMSSGRHHYAMPEETFIIIETQSGKLITTPSQIRQLWPTDCDLIPVLENIMGWQSPDEKVLLPVDYLQLAELKRQVHKTYVILSDFDQTKLQNDLNDYNRRNRSHWQISDRACTSKRNLFTLLGDQNNGKRS